MSETIIAALIAAASAIIVNIMTAVSQSSKTHALIEREMAIIKVQIDTLSDRVEKHNSIVERTYRLEEQHAVQQEQIATLRAKVEAPRT